MRKSLLFVALLIVSQLNNVNAQSMFGVPDTVCERQPVFITDSVTATSYYWGFCSGYLLNTPTGNNLGTLPDFSLPTGIEIVKDGNDYYGFVTNAGTNELVRLSFGNSLGNTPTATNFGTLNNTMPDSPSDLYITTDSAGSWFVFITGGASAATSSITRVDFGNSLGSVPNSVNFGNLDNLLNIPRGLFVQKEGTDYIGYLVNNGDDKLIRLNFGNNISLTPTLTDLNSIFALAQPSDMVPVNDTGTWYLFVTNQGDNTITRINLGNSLLNFPVATNIGNANNTLAGPSSISYIMDCDGRHLFVANETSSNITRIDISDFNSPPFPGTEFIGVGSLMGPRGMSRFIREKDNLYSYVTNAGDNTYSQIVFAQCTNASIPSSTDQTPPVFSYNAAGRYNVYLAINEGLPDMRVECKQIDVIPIPDMTVHNDTIICQGDTIELFVQAFGSLSYTWRPNYNISDTLSFHPKIWPEYTIDYRVVIPYPSGCIVDTGVLVEVRKNRADAGPDRTIFDGARTLLGGPLTSEGTQYTYTWTPNQFINEVGGTNPVVNPPYDFTYYLEVRNDFGCYDIDTVVVRVTCNDLNLPNAFAPESDNPRSNRFGVMNKQIVKLNYLRIFDRWGKQVFETTDVTRQWDGRVNGEPAPFGVYVWEADGFCVEGRRFKRSGNVTLMR